MGLVLFQYSIIGTDSISIIYPDGIEKYYVKTINKKKLRFISEKYDFILYRLNIDPMLNEMFSEDLEKNNEAGSAFAERTFKHYRRHKCR